MSSKAEEAGASSSKADKEEEDKDQKASSSSSSEEPPLPLHERFAKDVGALFGSLKSMLGSAGSAGSSSSATSGGGTGASSEDPGAGAVVVRPPSFWEKHFDQESPFFQRVRGFMGGAGDAAGGVTDRIFGQTEQAEAMLLLRETHPDFDQEAFLEGISEDLAPDVLGAYLKGDLDRLRETTREQAYAMLAASVNERKERSLLMDDRILYMSEPELESIRIIGGHPTPIVSFETHQVYCLRHGLNGSIVEGSEDDIRAFHYLWALQPNVEEESEVQWQVTELAIRGVLETY